MPKKPKSVLGSITTPFGDVLIHIERHAYSGRLGFLCRGHHHALRWLVPARTIKDGVTKTLLLPPDHCVKVEDLHRLFDAMTRAAVQRMQSEPSPSKAPSPKTIGQILDLIRVEAKSSLRASTYVTYEHEWKGLLAHIPGETAVRDITREMVQTMVARKIAEGLSPVTVHKHVVQLNRIMVRALYDDLIDRNPCAGVKLPRSIKDKPRFLSEVQRHRLLAAAQKHGRDSYLLIACGIYLGLRKAELLAMRWEQIDLDERLAFVKNQEHFTTKSGKERSVPLCEELAEILLRFHAGTGLVLKPKNPYCPDRRYRWDFRTLLSRCCSDAGLDPDEVSPHVLRHTFASIAAQKGVSLYKIATWMGHSQIEVTELYAHLAAYDDDINKLNPSAVKPPHRHTLRIVE